jgi:CDGSH-type Zn-finger protein
MRPPVIAQKVPYAVNLEEGKSYLWCACGRSQKQPFCDSSHVGSGRTPKRFQAQRTGTVYLCGCKYSKTPPFCDGSHRDIEEES